MSLWNCGHLDYLGECSVCVCVCVCVCSIKGGSYIYTLSKLMNTYHIYTACMSPNQKFCTTNVVMRSEYGKEYCSISTRECHMYRL